MVSLALVIIITCIGTAAAWAQTTCQTVGTTTFCNGPDGSNSTGQKVGDFTYWNGTTRVPDPDGAGTRSVPHNQTCQTIGNVRYCN